MHPLPTQKSFSPFSWLLAIFCIPSALWPLALLVSPKFSTHPDLTAGQIDAFSIIFWVYPFVLLAYAGICYTIHKKQPSLAKGLIAIGFIAFYALAGYIFKTVF